MSSEKDPHRYDDLIHRERFVSKKHPPMSLHDRAAQFSPFAALTGYEDSIRETARITERERELSEPEKAELDHRFQLLEKHIREHPEVIITCFEPDRKKSGGSYETYRFRAKAIDRIRRILVSTDKEKYRLDHITSLNGAFLKEEADPSS